MALIDLSNYMTELVQSTDSRAGTPDGNVYFDKTTGKIEFISSTELVSFIVTDVNNTHYTNGTDVITNTLLETDGLKFEAVYAFENQERANDEILRQYDRWTSGTFKFGGAYNFINARVPSLIGDSKILRGSGWNELDANGVPLKKWFGNKGLSNIEALSQPYYQQDIQGTSVDFAKVGQIDESILVYHDSTGDGNPDTLDKVTYEAVSIRTYGNNYDRKNTVDDLGISELGGYSTGFALNESIHLTTNEIDMPYANVYTTPAGVWVGMELNNIASPTAKTGEFSNDDGTLLFSWELINPSSANLDEMVAWMDAFSTELDEADGLGVITGNLGKDIETWYYYNAAGQVVTKSGVDPLTEGLYLNNIPTADQQRAVMTADDQTIKAYSFSVSVEAEIGSTAKGDVNAWYHSFGSPAYNTAGAITVQDSSSQPVKGLASTADVNNKIVFAFDYTGDTNLGTADTDKECVFLCEGDGGATQQKTIYTIKKLTTVAFSCSPAVENNV